MKKGLFITRHRGELSRIVDVDELARAYRDLAVVQVYDKVFEQAELRDILFRVKEKKLDAIVLAGQASNFSETSRIGKVFIKALKQVGLNQNRVHFTNIYEQAALVHADQPGCATHKARILIDAALAKAEYCQNVETVAISPRQIVLVVGLTHNGLLVAEQLLSANCEIVIISQSKDRHDLNSENDETKARHKKVTTHSKVRTFYESNITDMSGWSGDFKTVLKTPHGTRELSVGGIFLCVDDDRSWIEHLKPIMHLDTDDDGYLLNGAGNRYGGETRDMGIWFAPPPGLVPKPASVLAILKAGAKALSEMLDSRRIEHSLLVSEVDAALCGGCGTCIKTCAFSASTIDFKENISVIDPQRCRGCGNCVTACPTSARDLVTFPTLYVNRAIEIMSQGASFDNDPKILAFLCRNSGKLAVDAAGRYVKDNGGGGYSPNIMPLIMACGGNIDTVYLLKAFKEGFDGVALVVCNDRQCHNLVGNTDMERRVGLLRAVLRSRRMDDNRMRIIHARGNDGKHLLDELNDFSLELRQLNRVYA